MTSSKMLSISHCSDIFTVDNCIVTFKMLKSIINRQTHFISWNYSFGGFPSNRKLILNVVNVWTRINDVVAVCSSCFNFNSNKFHQKDHKISSKFRQNTSHLIITMNFDDCGSFIVILSHEFRKRNYEPTN